MVKASELLGIGQGSGGGCSPYLPVQATSGDTIAAFQQVYFTEGVGLQATQDSTKYLLTGATLLQTLGVLGVNSNLTGMAISDDGLQIYALTTGATIDIEQYTMSTAYDLSTATLTNTLNITATSTGVVDAKLKPDGLKLFICDENNDRILEYTMSTAYDLSTATLTYTFSVVTEDTRPRGVFFKPDGLKMYVNGDTNDTIYQYSLATAWDLSTASYDAVSAPNPSPGITTQTFYISPDGLLIFVTDSFIQRKYPLSSAWDLTTIGSELESLNFGFNGLSQWFIDSGSTLFIADPNADAIKKYNTNVLNADSYVVGDSVSGAAPGSPFTLVLNSCGVIEVPTAAVGDILTDDNPIILNGTGTRVGICINSGEILTIGIAP